MWQWTGYRLELVRFTLIQSANNFPELQIYFVRGGNEFDIRLSPTLPLWRSWIKYWIVPSLMMRFPSLLRLNPPKNVSIVAGIHHQAHPPHHRRRSHAGAAVTPVRRLSGGGGGGGVEALGRRQQQQDQGKRRRETVSFSCGTILVSGLCLSYLSNSRWWSHNSVDFCYNSIFQVIVSWVMAA